MDSDQPALVALRDRREAVIQILTDGFANDLLSLDQFDDRIARAHAASDVATLDGLVADLAALPAGGKHTALARVQVDPQLAAQTERRRLSAIFSHVQRRGTWSVPRELRINAVFGHAELDLREARFAPGTTEIEVRCVFGNLELIVPPNLAVECEGNAIFGNFEDHGGASTVADPERPLVRVRGNAVFGNVEVIVRLPGENAFQAYRRRRRERKAALAEAKRKQLPAHDQEP